MIASLQQLSDANPLVAVLLLLCCLLAYTLLVFVPLCGLCYLIYFLLTLPMRRAERARYFLDLLEFGLNRGQSPEAALIAASRSRDRAPGVRFHLLAAYLEKGMSFSQALVAVPRLLPLEIQSILTFAQPAVDLKKLLAPCRRILEDSVSQVRG